jgi:hypothetical protein
LRHWHYAITLGYYIEIIDEIPLRHAITSYARLLFSFDYADISWGWQATPLITLSDIDFRLYAITPLFHYATLHINSMMLLTFSPLLIIIDYADIDSHIDY